MSYSDLSKAIQDYIDAQIKIGAKAKDITDEIRCNGYNRVREQFGKEIAMKAFHKERVII